MKNNRTSEPDQRPYRIIVCFFSILCLVFILQSVKTVDAGQETEVAQERLSIHQPVSAGDCSVCHSGVSFETINLEDKTCTGCHQKYDTMSTVGAQKSGHGEFECMDCHEAHSSDYRALLVMPISELCASCHDVEPSSPNKYSHFQDSCNYCHDPHAVNTRYYLSASSLDLCQKKCHSSQKLGRSHPMGAGVRDKYANTIMTCTSSCHRMHNSNYPTYLSVNPDKICYRCHSRIFVGGNGTLAQVTDR